MADHTWNAADYAMNAGFVPELGEEILSWLAPIPGERILDLGCGDGVLTARLVEAGAVVLGVDNSAELLEAARGRGLNVNQIDGQELPFSEQFDAVFSNAALHWMPRAEDVIAGVYRALVPGGRFVAEFGGHGNIAAITTALRAVAKTRGLDRSLAGGWFYPTAAEYSGLLEDNGFTVERIGLYPRPTPLPTGIRAWLRTFRGPFLESLADPESVLDEIEDLLSPSLRDSRGQWTADYVRLRVAAVRAHT